MKPSKTKKGRTVSSAEGNLTGLEEGECEETRPGGQDREPIIGHWTLGKKFLLERAAWAPVSSEGSRARSGRRAAQRTGCRWSDAMAHLVLKARLNGLERKDQQMGPGWRTFRVCRAI